jgi:hypothetical protein
MKRLSFSLLSIAISSFSRPGNLHHLRFGLGAGLLMGLAVGLCEEVLNYYGLDAVEEDWDDDDDDEFV